VNAHVLVRTTEFNALKAIFADGGARTVDDVLKDFVEPIRPLVVRVLHWLIKIGLLQMAAADGQGQ
jgi:hypothetical protein